MKNNLPLLARLRKKGNDSTLIAALISKTVKDFSHEKLGYEAIKIEVSVKERVILIQTPSSLVAGELRIYVEEIKKASIEKLLKLGYTLTDETRFVIR